MAFCKVIGTYRFLRSFGYRRLVADGCIMTKYSKIHHFDDICKTFASTKASKASVKNVSAGQEIETDNKHASDTDRTTLDVKNLTDKITNSKSKTRAKKTLKAGKSEADKENEKPTQPNEEQLSLDKLTASATESETNSVKSKSTKTKTTADKTSKTKTSADKTTKTKTSADKTSKTAKIKTVQENEKVAMFDTPQSSEEKPTNEHESEIIPKESVKGKTMKSKDRKTTTTEGESVPQKEVKSDRYDIEIPEWMKVVLECPANAEDKIDTDKFLKFKDFIEELEMKRLPSVTTIIKQTEPEEQAKVLIQWMKRKTKELGGKEQFEQYRQKLLTRGSSLHTYIEQYLAGERDFDIAPHIEGPWESIQHVLPEISDVKRTEKLIAHPDLFYKGQIDCLAAYRNDISVIEWKVSTKPKLTLSQTYDYPLQVAAYLGALNRSGVSQRLEVPNLTTGVIVIAYEDGEPATVHVMSERICNKYWGRWKERLFHYWALQYQKMLNVT